MPSFFVPELNHLNFVKSIAYIAMVESGEDKDIVFRLQSGESQNEAFGELMRKYREPMYYYIRRMIIDHDDCDDVLQNTFIKAWKGISSFRRESKLSTWLYRIATNESISFIRKKQRIAGIPLEDVEYQLPSFLSNDVLYDGDEIQRILDSAVAALPEKQKAVFILKYFEDRKYDEIAEITGTSVGALKASYHHAVKKIEERLSRY